MILYLTPFIGTYVYNERQKQKCYACNNPTKCLNTDNTVQCTVCFKLFYSTACANNHIKNKRCIKHSYKCTKCKRIIKTNRRSIEEHICDEISCYNCKGWFAADHNCYMQRKKVEKPSEKYVFFDFETELVNNQHVINYCIAQYCDGTENIFRSIDDFCTWALSKERKGYTFIAHYGKGYDFQFVHEWLIQKGIKPQITSTG